MCFIVGIKYFVSYVLDCFGSIIVVVYEVYFFYSFQGIFFVVVYV